MATSLVPLDSRLKGLGLNPHWGERIESYDAYFQPGV